MPLSTEILHVTKISGLRGVPVDRVEVCYKVSHSFCTSAILFGVPSDAVLLFCTGKCPLVYQAMPHGCFVHGSALWCTSRCRAAVLYRETPFGVPSDAVLLFCTWERPLVYQAMPCCCFVQGNALCVPSDNVLPFCTGKRPLVYQVIPCCCFVHGSALWCTKRCRTAVLYMGAPSGVPSDAVLLFCTGTWPVVYRLDIVPDAVR